MTHPLLERAQQAGTPLIDGDQVTFVWQGAEPAVLVGEMGGGWSPGSGMIMQAAAPDLWTHTFTLPVDAYLEYSFFSAGKYQTDPLNPRQTPDGLGSLHSYFYMSGGPTPLARRKRGMPRGTVTRHTVEHPQFLARGKRSVWLYQPAVSAPSPLLVVFDGPDYLRRAKLTAIVDNLIAQKRIQPLALALAANGRKARYIEYACSDATLGFIEHALIPLARTHLRLLDPGAHPAGYGVLGASMGGLMALYAGLRLPHLFGRVLSQSGAFTIFEHEMSVWDWVRYAPPPPLKIWMDAGRYESLLQTNRQMQALLAERGFDVSYREYNAGHNYPAWRDDVWRGLEHLFPPRA